MPGFLTCWVERMGRDGMVLCPLGFVLFFLKDFIGFDILFYNRKDCVQL